MKKTKFLLMTFLLSLFSMVGYAQADLVIQDLNDLKAFRDAVNAGDNFGGKVVELTADINLAEVENWVPIGDGTLQGNYGFSGTFEGNGHTISNLKCTNKKYGGLFGRFYGTVQNLTVENVNITTNHWAGGIVAYEDHEKGQLSVNNCTVDGGTITCLVEGEEGSYDNGDKVGGIIGALQTNDKVTNCTVKNLTIQGYRDVGGIAGYAGNASVVTGNKVTDVTIIQDMTKFYGAPDRNTAYENQKNNVGEIVGRDTGTASTEGNVATNTTIKVIPAVARYNDTTYFTLQDAIDAVANVPANEPQTIEMLMDHEIAAQTGVTIASDQNIVLDLNGFTVKVNVNEESESQVITNKGTLTITDSSEEGTGTLTNEIAEGVKADYWGYYGCDYRMNIITNKGNLTIESGTIENKDKGDTGDSGDSAFAIANDNSEGNATLIVNGGKAIAQYIAVGFLCLSETNENNIQVTGGEIRGGFSGIYTLVSGTEIYQRKGSLTISGGHVYGRYYSFTDDTPQFRNKANEVFANIKYEISGGDIESDGDENFSILCVFDDSFEGFVTGGYFKPNPGDWYSADERKFIEVEEHNGESGWYTLEINTDNAVAHNIITDKYYTTLADAVADVPANEPQTIEMLMDHEIAAQTGVTIASDQNIVLDLNGFTVKVNVNEESESQVITNKGTLTITDSSEEGTGTLTNEIAEGVKADYWGYYGCDYRMNIITNKGNLTIESGTIENKDKGDTGDSGDSAFAIANDNSEGNATLIVNGGKAIAQYIAVGFLCLSETNENNIQVTGGEIRGGFSGIYTLVSGTEIYQRKGSLTISGGHVYGRYYSFTDDTPQFRNKANEVFANIKYEISGGDIESDGDENFSILCVFDDSFEGFVTGGYFKPNPGDWYSADERKFIEVEEHNGESGWWTLGTFTQLIIYDQTPSSKWTPYEELEDYWGQTVDELTYRREFAENKGTNYQSWFVPFDYTITEEAAEKFDFYKIHMVAASKDEGVIDNNSEEEVWMYIYQAPAGTTLHGNRPYIIKAKEAGTLYDFVLKDVYMMPETDVSTLNVSTSHYNYDFFGTYHEVHPEGKWFTLNVDGLLKWNANQVRGYRWYVKPTLKLGEDEYADITFVIVEEGDDTNSVTKVHGDTKVEMEGIYTVDGIKLSQPVKGVNIMKFSDGSIKKVFIK